MHKKRDIFMVNVTKIRELCAEKGMTLSFLCRKVGVPATFINDLERKYAKPTTERIEAIANVLDVSVDYLTDKTDVRERKGGVKIKVYGTIAAGIPIDAIEEVIDEEEISAAMARDGEYIGLKVKGDSMQPLIPNGAYAIIRRQPDCESGQIAAVLVNGENATLKRVFKNFNGIVLAAENPKYAPMAFSNDDISQKPITIIGVLKETRMKF